MRWEDAETGHRQFKRGLGGFRFLFGFFAQGFGFTSSCFSRSSPTVQCRDEKHVILILEFIIQLALQAKKKK